MELNEHNNPLEDETDALLSEIAKILPEEHKLADVNRVGFFVEGEPEDWGVLSGMNYRAYQQLCKPMAGVVTEQALVSWDEKFTLMVD